MAGNKKLLKSFKIAPIRKGGGLKNLGVVPNKRGKTRGGGKTKGGSKSKGGGGGQ